MCCNNLKLLKSLLLAIIIGGVFGCNTELEPNLDDFGFEYYPTKVGDYRIYHTTTIAYNLDGTIDTVTYLVKEIAEKEVIYSDGNAKIILGRYSADIDNFKWKKDSIWSVIIDDSKIIVSEATKDFVKLTFPVSEEKQWDGNATNALQSEFYKIIDLKKSYSYDTLSYDNTLTVVHQDLIDPAKITEDDYRIEVFAAEVGLVHKLKIKINYCSNCVENGKIDDGFIFEQKLIEFGTE